MNITPLASFDMDHLQINSEFLIARSPVERALEYTFSQKTHEYFILLASSEKAGIGILPITSKEHGAQALSDYLDELVKNSSLLLSHVVCHGVVLGQYSPNGKLFARDPVDKTMMVEVNTLDELRQKHLSPVIDHDMIDVMRNIVKNKPGQYTANIAEKARLYGVTHHVMENAFVCMMSGMLHPADAAQQDLIAACRDVIMDLEPIAGSGFELLWQQLEKATGGPVEKPQRQVAHKYNGSGNEKEPEYSQPMNELKPEQSRPRI